MSSDLTLLPDSKPRGWASRLLGSLGSRKSPAPGRSATARVRKVDHDPAQAGSDREARSIQSMTRQLIAEDRYSFVLLAEAAESVGPRDVQSAWQALDKQMALVPAGIAPVACSDGQVRPTEVAAFYLDRFAVTNRQFARFVTAGCYDQLEIWPREIWPGLLRFTDRSGRPGPRAWDNGTYPSELADHPVTGVSWYEALAYARWVGKRMPSAAEWQKAAGWPEQLSGGACNRYPWGDLFAEGRANLWAGGPGRTVPVHEYREGATPNGIYQLAGNVWEWLEDPLDTIPCRGGEAMRPYKPLRRIAGGAFDTYLAAEAANQFITGQPELDRRDNIGFRCALSADALQPLVQPDDHPTRSPER